MLLCMRYHFYKYYCRSSHVFRTLFDFMFVGFSTIHLKDLLGWLLFSTEKMGFLMMACAQSPSYECCKVIRNNKLA